jgi:hypothetical protein
MYIEHTPYWFNKELIAELEKHYNSKYIGPWCAKNRDGCWQETPLEVFYQANPDRSKGHTNFLGLFTREGKLFVTNAESAFSEPITGVLCADGEVIVSRFRRDFIQKKGKMIDGGRDYIRSFGGPYVSVTIVDGEFTFSLIEDIHTRGWENENDDGQMEFDFGV